MQFRTTFMAIVAMLAASFGAPLAANGCGEICQQEFWDKAKAEEVDAAIKQVEVKARDINGSTPLHFAAKNGNRENVESLISTGANVNARNKGGATPLSWAMDAPDNAEALLNAGADVDSRGMFGMTILSTAAGQGNVDTVLLLLERGADVNAKDEDGTTPLHVAAMLGTPEMVTILLDAGADGKAKGLAGMQPWHLAGTNKRVKNTDAYWRLNEARY